MNYQSTVKRRRHAKAFIPSALIILPLLVGCDPSTWEIENARTINELNELEEECCRAWDLDDQEKLDLIRRRRKDMESDRKRRDMEIEREMQRQREEMDREMKRESE